MTAIFRRKNFRWQKMFT